MKNQNELTMKDAIKKLQELEFDMTVTEVYINLHFESGCFNINFDQVNDIFENEITIRFESPTTYITLYKQSKTFHVANF